MSIEQFSRSLPIMLYRTVDAVMPRFRQIFQDAGLTEQQWRVLRVLWDENEAGASRIAELAVISPPSLVGVIDRLEKKGLVARRKSHQDRRAINIALTAAGRDLERVVMPRVATAYADLKQSVDAEAWDQLMAALEQLNAAVGGD